MRSLLFTICTLILACACRQQENKVSLKHFDWLLGDWEQTSDSIPYYEHWEQVNDTLYRGFGIVSVPGDTMFYESIDLQYRTDGIYYVVSSPGQNNDSSVAFQYTGDSSGLSLFINAAHDFPQRIVYGHPTKDSLVAWVDGYIDGQYERSDFPMVRKK